MLFMHSWLLDSGRRIIPMKKNVAMGAARRGNSGICSISHEFHVEFAVAARARLPAREVSDRPILA
jgi:hypothetical protein